MIVVRLLGGLGNQMFQYAFGRALAERRAVSLKLDIASFETYSLRRYALQHFGIIAELLSPEERKQLGLPRDETTRLSRLVERFLQPAAIAVVDEHSFEFDPALLDVRAPCYLRGYWQSPKYFASIESMIRREFTVQAPPNTANLNAARVVTGCDSVSVHVRRGDYVESETTGRFHGLCDPSYYRAAEAHLRERLRNPKLFVFSDDPDWAEQNLRLTAPATYFRHNGPEQDFEDLRLMALCKHHIIANSTFSWWGAWLCDNPNKTVIAPRNWFREANHSTRDLIPANWVRL